MQAMILAAGMGRRLGKYTENGTKCMVTVGDKTLIERSIDALQEAGISRFVMVVGYRATILMDFINLRYPNLDVRWVENCDYASTNNIYSLALAKDELQADDTILLESDLIFRNEIIRQLVDSPDPDVAVVSRFESWMDGTVTLVGDDNSIISVIDKKRFKWKNISEYFKTVNIYKFSRQFSRKYYVPFLEAYMKSFGSNQYYEQVLNVLSMIGDSRIKALPVKGRLWYEIDDPHDLSVAESIFAEKETRLSLMQKRYGGYWRFPSMLDYCYLVNPFYPPKSLVNEIKSSFTNLMGHYPSGAETQSILAGKMFSVDPAHIAVGNGAAELIDIYARITSGSVAMANPAFNEYPARFGKERTILIDTAEDDFSYDERFLLEAGADADTLLLVNPDNPSGNFLDRKSVEVLLEITKRRKQTLIVDESFADFADPERRFTLLSEDILTNYPQLVVIKSISKSYGVPGFRLGLLASSNSELIARIKSTIPVWNINSFGEFYMQIADKYATDYLAGCDKIAAERWRMASMVDEIPEIKVYPSQANYIMCRISDNAGSRHVTRHLLTDHNIFIKDLSGKPGFPEGEFIRLAIRRPKENNRLVEAMRLVIAEHRTDA
jgi:histidinol-phosphate/aromatic aminotransferase/cobyric acid decarboxylase-like protein/choline kinase